MNLDDLQAQARSYQHERRIIEVMQAAIPARRRTPTPPAPMANLTESTIIVTLLKLDATSIKLYVRLSSYTPEDGIVKVTRDDLATATGTSVSTVSRSSATLRANGLIQRQGRFGYLVRRTER